MAAGLGFKTFTTGEVLTAADTNGYLMQGVLVFASTAARDAAITSPQEGQFAFTKDTDSLWYRSASAWVASGATGDIEGVTAGVGISGGGTSGTVTVTNDMATTITAAGDIVVGTGSGTYDNLPIGTTNQILTADTSVSPYKVKWATAGGGKVVQIVAATYDTGTSNSTTTFADTGLTATITPTSASNKILVIWDQGGLQKTATNASSELELKLLRGATTIATGYAGLTATALNNNPGNVGATILDEPATTSATTYKSQFRNGVNAASVVVQYNAGTSSLVLMEVTP